MKRVSCHWNYMQILFISLIFYPRSDTLEEYPEIKYCFSSMDLLDGSQTSNFYILKRDLGKSCTHVYGNIVINNIISSMNGSEPDLDFLASIKEITGSLKIRNSNVSVIPLRNLRIIRGNPTIHSRDWVEGLQNSLEISWDNYSPKFLSVKSIIDLRSLRSIVNGNIKISSVFCQGLARIDWDELLEDPNKQRVTGKCTSSLFQCSDSCALKNSQRFCWGPLDSQCQIFSKCQKRMCANRCFLSKTNDEECCNSQCLGGCTSSTPDSCIACQAVLNGTSCQAECSQKYILNRDNGVPVPNKNFRPLFINVCLSKCPDSLLEQEGECKTQCTYRKYIQKGNQCVPCKQFCERICTMDDIYSERDKLTSSLSLDALKIKKLANCTTFKGSIQIDSESFITYSSDTVPITDAQDLWYLNKLRHVSGSIYIDLKDAKFKLDNLSFLNNLEVIEGGHNKNIPVSFGIYDTNISFLGLANLKTIGLKGQKNDPIMLRNNPHLCYFDVDKFRQKIKFENEIKVIKIGNISTCEKLGKVCHIECEPSLGCWGPGPSQCVACFNVKLGNSCAKNCYMEPGYLLDPNLKNKECLKCHEECSKTCSGIRPDQCIGGCKNAMEDHNCVPKCSRNHYLNNITKICERCHPDCHPRNITRLPVCTGPSSKPGPGGCNKCQALILSYADHILEPVQCYNNQTLKSYFSENHKNRGNSQFSQFSEKYTDLIVTYQPCYKNCTKCTFYTYQRIKLSTTDWSGCTECSGYWYENNCVLSCPSNITYFKRDETKTSLGQCIQCNPQCLGCYGDGNDKCYNCKKFRIYDERNTSQFSCIENCPRKYEQAVLNKNPNQVVCVFMLLSRLELVLVVLAIIFFIFLLIFAIIISRFFHVKKEKRRTEKLTAHFSNVNERDSHENNTIPQDIIYLTVISSDNLEFSLGSEMLGKGTFGCVYAGRWKPEMKNFDDSSSMNSCMDKKVDIVIKVLNESCDQNEFMEEVRIMASVRHKHCLRLIGVSFKNQMRLLISAYMPLGSMDKYLKNKEKSLTGRILLIWAEQIANGMLYLERNHIIHRDLATRNVLIYKETHVQITDFGLSKIIKPNKGEIQIVGGMVPVRWLAIETLREGIYSHKTDVWAFGVTLWEIFSFAKIPYESVKANEIRDEIIKGTRLCQPEICSLDIYILMLKCWSVDAVERPTFEYLWTEFKMYSNNSETYLSYPNVGIQYGNDMINNYTEVITHNDDQLSIINKPEKIMRLNSLNDSINSRNSSRADIIIPDNLKSLLYLDLPKRNMFYESANEFKSPRNNFSKKNGYSNFNDYLVTEMASSPFTKEYLEPLTTKF